MSTQYKRAAAVAENVAETLQSLKREDVRSPDSSAKTWAESLHTAIGQLADLRIDGMRKKASESDPQKRIYGPAMSAKVLDLAERIDGLRDELEQLVAQARSLTEARAADQAACTGSEPDAEHSTVPLEGAWFDSGMQSTQGIFASDPEAAAASQQGAVVPQSGKGGLVGSPARKAKPEMGPGQKPTLPKRPGAARKSASAFHAASQRAPPPEGSPSTTQDCDTEPTQAPNAATQRYQRDVYRGKSGQLADRPAPATTLRSHSAGLPASVRGHRAPPPLPISVTRQRSLQPSHVGLQPPRPPMSASEYQRRIYRGDPGRLTATCGGPAAQPQPGGAPVGGATLEPEEQVTTAHGGAAEQQQWSSTPASHAVTEPEEPGGAAPACSKHVDLSQESEAVPQGSGSQEAGIAGEAETPARACGSAAADVAAAQNSPQKTRPEAAARSKEGADDRAPHEGSSSAAQPPAVPAQRLDMPPLPRPEVRHVQLGKAEVDEVLKEAMQKAVLLDFSASWCGPCRMMKPILERLVQRYWGVLDILAIDCEATAANRQLAQQYGITGFPTFVLLHKGRRVDQFSGARPEPAMAQYLEWHMSQAGASDALLQQRLVAALSHLQQHASPEAFRRAASMLLTIVGNVVDHPGEAKYRRIRRASTAFQQSLGSLPGGCESLQAIGFTIYAEPNGEQVLSMSDIPRDLGALRTLLAAAIGGAAGPSSSASAVHAESGGQVAPQVAPAVQPPGSGEASQGRAIGPLVAGLPRPPRRIQGDTRLGAQDIDALAGRLARSIAEMQGHSPRNGRPSDDVREAAGGAVSGSSAEVDEDDPELSDVLKRSLEEH